MTETLREAASSLTRTVGRTFIFAGRARRLDVGYYWIASMIVSGVGKLALGSELDLASALAPSEAVDLVVAVPFFALFARRLHDQGRSAWWTVALLPLVAANAYEHVRVTLHAFDGAWPGLGKWNLLLALLAIGYLSAMLVPGDRGPNRHGNDPRLDERPLADIS